MADLILQTGPGHVVVIKAGSEIFAHPLGLRVVDAAGQERVVPFPEGADVLETMPAFLGGAT